MLWMIVGLIVGVSAYWLVTTLQNRKLRVTWYEWLIGILALGLGLIGLQNFLGSLEELEPQAAWVMLGMFGVPALFFAGLTGYLVWRQNKPAKTIPPTQVNP